MTRLIVTAPSMSNAYFYIAIYEKVYLYTSWLLAILLHDLTELLPEAQETTLAF